jgi:AraC-like DNA-binding protein
MNQTTINVYQEDTYDFRMEHDKIDGASILIMDQNHYHRSYEVYYQLYGEKYYFIKDKTYKIETGDIVLINSYELHRTSLVNNNPTERILVRINDTFINNVTDPYPSIDLFSIFKGTIPILRLSNDKSIEIRNHLFKMLQQYTNYKIDNSPMCTLYLKTLTIELLILLHNFYYSNLYNNFEHPSNIHKKISEAVYYINNNYMTTISLNTLSSMFHVSKFHFARLFKSVTGLTLVDYLNIIRLKESLNILIGTDYSISRVSSEVGYSDSSYYCRVFKKYYNCSPANYRKQYIKHLQKND